MRDRKKMNECLWCKQTQKSREFWCGSDRCRTCREGEALSTVSDAQLASINWSAVPELVRACSVVVMEEYIGVYGGGKNLASWMDLRTALKALEEKNYGDDI